MSSVIKARDIALASAAESNAPAAVAVGDEPSDIRTLAQQLLSSAPLGHFANEQARRTVAEAREEADAIVRAAEEERSSVLEAARVEGYTSGLEDGRLQGLDVGRAELRDHIEVFVGMCDEIGRVRADLIAQHEQDIVELAVALAGRVTKHSLPDVGTARQLLTEMLPRTAGTRDVTIKLNPADLETIRAEADTLAVLADEQATITWVAETRLPSGSVVVETERGSLDGTIATRARRLVEQMLEVIDDGD